MPLVLLLAEAGLGLAEALDAIADTVRRHGRALVVVSEGFDAGALGEVRDSFGHVAFGASRQTAAQLLVNALNERGLPARGAARGEVPGTAQRHAIACASVVDLGEAYRVGQQAVLVARTDGTGWMATILRHPGPIYDVTYGKVALAEVAVSERAFPREWIAPSRIDVTDEFLDYARPLIGEDRVSVPRVGGRQRFARLAPIFAAKKLPPYQPQGERVNAERGMRNVE
jgi:6-phosphofructokinase 1